MQPQDFVKAALFVALACAWLVVRAWPTEGVPARDPAGPLPGAVTPASPAPEARAGISETTAPTTTAESGSTPAPPAQAGNQPVSPKTAETPPARAGLSEAELLSRLDADARAYAAALQANDFPGVGARLAQRCAETDIASLVTRRKAELKAYTGIAIEQMSVISPLVGHVDVKEGVAHAFLGLEYQGKRLDLGSTDGWLYEDGHWRNAEC